MRKKYLFISLVLAALPFLSLPVRHFFLVDLAWSFLPWGVLVYLILVFVAVLLRMRRVMILNFLVVVLLSSMMVLPLKEEVLGDEKFRVSFSNIFWKNERISESLPDFEALDSDVWAFVELENLVWDLGKDFWTKFEYQSPIAIGFLEGIMANHFFTDYEVLSSGAGNFEAPVNYFQVRIEGEVYNFYVVHTTAPEKKSFWKKRNAELMEIAKVVSACESKCIVMGDLNVAPWSIYFREFEKSLGEEFDLVNDNQGVWLPTWSPHWFLFDVVPLDYLFVSKDIRVRDFSLIEVKGSDHKGFTFVVAGD